MKFSMGQQLSQANLLEALISCFESILENGNLINTAPDTDDASLPSVLSDFHDFNLIPKLDKNQSWLNYQNAFYTS